MIYVPSPSLETGIAFEKYEVKSKKVGTRKANLIRKIVNSFWQNICCSHSFIFAATTFPISKRHSRLSTLQKSFFFKLNGRLTLHFNTWVPGWEQNFFETVNDPGLEFFVSFLPHLFLFNLVNYRLFGEPSFCSEFHTEVEQWRGHHRNIKYRCQDLVFPVRKPSQVEKKSG